MSDSLKHLGDLIGDMGHHVDFEQDAEHALGMLERKGSFVVFLADMTAARDGCTDILRRIGETRTRKRVIAIVDADSRTRAMDLIGDGECYCVSDPPDMKELKLIVENISEVHSLTREVTAHERRVSHLEVINEIASETLITRDRNTLLWKIAHLIHSKLSYYNVNIFTVDDNGGNTVVLRAFAGGFGDDLTAGFSLPFGEGICGWVAEHREPLLVNDVQADGRRIQGFSFEEHVGSELGVPILFNEETLGVLHVESRRTDAFNPNDVMVLQTVADQMALAFENWRLANELLDAYELSSAINDSLPVSIVLVDARVSVRYVNRTFCETVNMRLEDVLNHSLDDLFAADLTEKARLSENVADALESGNPICLNNIYHTSPHHSDKVLNITITRVQGGKHPQALILIQDVTDFTIKTRQLSLIREISIAMQGVFDRDRLLNMILTSVTAGFAIGFNRAFLFLIDREHNSLTGIMGVGPRSHEEAYYIWSELARNNFTFQRYLDEVSTVDVLQRSALQDVVEGVVFDLSAADNVLAETARQREHIHITDAWNNPMVDDGVRMLLAGPEFVTMPLIAKNEVIGVLMADNSFSGEAISPESIDELEMFAAAAALAIENANMLQVLENQVRELGEAYTKLEKTHDMLIRHEKLAAIGEMSTRLAHEIRNPLATIGGFASSIPRKYEDRERTIRNAEIIIEEVRRLEGILTNVLDFTKTGVPQKERTDVNDFVMKTVRILEGNANEAGVLFVFNLAGEECTADFDPAQIRQVLINVIKNAINAMPGGGAIEMSTGSDDEWCRIAVKDTGKGIPEELLESIFDPFFTTRNDGTGLGLSISQRIVQNHGGKLGIESREGEGTTVTLLLPNTREKT